MQEVKTISGINKGDKKVLTKKKKTNLEEAKPLKHKFHEIPSRMLSGIEVDV